MGKTPRESGAKAKALGILQWNPRRVLGERVGT